MIDMETVPDSAYFVERDRYLASIAISLKRIADALERQVKEPEPAANLDATP